MDHQEMGVEESLQLQQEPPTIATNATNLGKAERLILLIFCSTNMRIISPLTRVSIKAMLLDILLGGTDTAFATLEWAMTELLRNPMVMKKLQSEVRGVMFGKQEDIMDEDLEKMQYLKAVVKETLRCHTPVPFLAREPHEDAKIMGYDIAARTMVIINSWAIGRDPSIR
ncbi:hypothetical protein ACS0TY_034919 [Phlomoides rotata]